MPEDQNTSTAQGDSGTQRPVSSGQLVFVGGLHRSGTTPLARVLASHPSVSGLSDTGVIEDEGQHLQQVYPPALAYGGSGHFARDARAHLTESSPLATPENAQRLLASWAPYWDESSPLLVEKSPPNLIMGRFLQQMFPDARFIMILRHPVTVALSNRKWTHFLSRNPRKFANLHMLVEHWMRAHALLEQDLPFLRHVAVVHYEELVGNPRATLDRLGEFLGLDSPIPADQVRSAPTLEYQQRWDSYARPTRPGGWQRALIERSHGDAIRAFGYDVADLSAWDASAASRLRA